MKHNRSKREGEVVSESGPFIRVLFKDKAPFEWCGCLRSNITTLDGRPIVGFKDPRDERIKELEAQVSEYVAWCDDLQDQLSSSTNPLAGLSDEQLTFLIGTYQDKYRQPWMECLRDLRDGKLGSPAGSPKNPEVPR